jgi:hypothetical protein
VFDIVATISITLNNWKNNNMWTYHVDAYYELNIEYSMTRDADYVSMYKMRKDRKQESCRFPSIRSLKVDPIIHPTILSINFWNLKELDKPTWFQ